MREQGFKTDLADFNVTTDPAMRARTKALTVFKNSLQFNALDDRLPLMAMVSNNAAVIVWQQDQLTLKHGILQWSDLRTILDTNHEVLDLACAAALSGPIRFDLNVNAKGTWTPQLAHLTALLRALGARAMLELHDGDSEGAWTNLLAVTRLSTAWEPEPTALVQFDRLFMTGDVFADTWQTLQNNNWLEAKLTFLQHEWEAADFFTNLPKTTAFYRAIAVDSCRRLSERKPFAGESFSDLATEIIKSPSAACSEVKDAIDSARYRGYEALNDQKDLLLLFQKRELDFRRACQSSTWVEMRSLPAMTNMVGIKPLSKHVMEEINYYQQLEGLMTASVAEDEARRRILIAAIALERYRGKHSAYPATLTALVPEFLQTTPLDFIDGHPLRYRRTEDGHFVLYSVGLDCVDDGGKMPSSSLSTAQNDHWVYVVPMNEDIVWPRPAPSRPQNPAQPL